MRTKEEQSDKSNSNPCERIFSSAISAPKLNFDRAGQSDAADPFDSPFRLGRLEGPQGSQAASLCSWSTPAATMATGRHRRSLMAILPKTAASPLTGLYLLRRRRGTGAQSDPTTSHDQQTRLQRTGVMIVSSLPTHLGREVRGHHSTADERLARLPIRLSPTVGLRDVA